MRNFYGRLQDIIDDGQALSIALIVDSKGSSPRKAGTRMIVFPDGSIEGTIGGGILEKRVIEDACNALTTGESRLIHYDLKEDTTDSIGSVCGGEVWIYIEPIALLPRLLILGGGHVGRALARMAIELELHVVVYDNRPEILEPDFFPSSVELICEPFDQAMQILKPREQDYIAIMTYNHLYDLDVLTEALKTPAQYVGVIASKKKMATFRETLSQKGIPQERINQIHGPIGLKIGGNHPSEIAVSILAELIQEKNQPSKSILV